MNIRETVEKLLRATSAVLPNLYFRYGKTGKKYYANLQCFILAAAASGKGIAGQALEMIEPIQERYPLLIPGDSTFPAFFKRLYEIWPKKLRYRA